MSFFGSLFGKTEATLIDNPVDFLTYVAGLSSDPTAIDPLLDPVRVISSAHKSGQPFTPQETATLFKAYLEVENHLITREPVRNFTKEGLRARLSPNLRQQLQNLTKVLK